MATSHGEISTNTLRISKACKGNFLDDFSLRTIQDGLGLHILDIRNNFAFLPRPRLDWCRMKLRHLTANIVSFYCHYNCILKRSSSFLKDDQEVVFGLKVASWDVIPIYIYMNSIIQYDE